MHGATVFLLFGILQQCLGSLTVKQVHKMLANDKPFISVEDIQNLNVELGGRRPTTQEVHDTLFKRLDKDLDHKISVSELSSTLGASADGYLQLHLALTSEPTSILLIWVTDSKDEGVAVSFGTNSGVYTRSQVSRTYTYSAGLFGWSKWLHSAVLSGLEPGTRYYYQVPGSVEHSFVLPVAKQQPVRIAFEGDQGVVQPLGYAVAEQMANDMKKGEIDVVHVVGDISYSWGTIPGPEIEGIWDYYLEVMAPLASNIPMMVTVGNHELANNGAIAFQNRFLMPSRGGPSSDSFPNFYYSYDYGIVHVISFSTESMAGFNETAQMAWIKQDLARAHANRKSVPWIVVTTHHPMYSSDSFAHDSHLPGSGEQRTWEKIFLGRVDLMISGHCHIYERIHPNINGTVTDTGNVYRNPKGLPHVVQGTGGAFYWDSFVTPTPEWSAARCAEHHCRYGYGNALFHNATHLQYQYRIEQDGSVYDEFWIVKDQA